MRRFLLVIVLVIVTMLSLGAGQESVGGCESHHEDPC